MALEESPTSYPFLTQEEFNLASHFLDQKYIAATLGQERRSFRLRLQHSLLTDSVSISITKPIDVSKYDIALSLDLQALRCEDDIVEPNILMDIDAENADSQALHPTFEHRNQDTTRLNLSDELPKYSRQPQQPYVIYEIHLHPTYRTPVLWFSLCDLPPCDSPFDIDCVYRYLVPDQYKDHLRSIGVVGGISAANHPLTDIPAFFIHPCGTKEAMEQFQCLLKDYISVWLGLVGGYIGLWLPQAMA